MTSFDPFIRIFIDTNRNMDINILPKVKKRIGIPADYKNHKLLDWNQRNSYLHGNHWEGAAWSDCEQGFIAQNYVRTNGVEIHKIMNYDENLNPYIQGHAYNFFNWQHNESKNWYSYVFYIDNENEYETNATIEAFIPDEITKVEFYNFYNNTNSPEPHYELIGKWNEKNYGSVLYFNDSKNIEHSIKVYKPLNRSETWNEIKVEIKMFHQIKRFQYLYQIRIQA